MNVMRHISVPNRHVEQVLGLIREHDLLAPSMHVFPAEDGKSRLIPLDFGAPLSLPDGLADFDIVEHEGKPDERVDSDWWTHLSGLLGEETAERHGEAWPSSH